MRQDRHMPRRAKHPRGGRSRFASAALGALRISELISIGMVASRSAKRRLFAERTTTLGGLLLLMALAVALCAGCATRVDLEVSRTFQEAQETFDDAESPDDFLRAAALYQSILDRGVVSGVVLYNQGNAYMQAGQRGRAVAAYRRAKRYRPRDPYLEANLQFALAADGRSGRRRPLIEYVLFWQPWLSYPEKFHVTFAAALVTFALGVAALFRRRRLFGRLAVVGAAIALLLAFSAGYDWYRYEAVTHGVVVRDDVIARKGNAATYEPAFTEPLSEATEFRLIERRGDWLLVGLSGGKGWVREADVVLY